VHPTRRPRSWGILLPILPIVCLAACTASKPPPRTAAPVEVVSTATAVASFDTAWALIDRNHFDAEHEGVDWLAVRRELRPKALEVTGREELRGLLRTMMSRLELSHFGLIPHEAVDLLRAGPDAADQNGAVGLDLRLVDDQLLVWRVDPGSPAAEAGIAPGWVLAAVDTTFFADVLGKTAEMVEADILAYQFVIMARSRLNGPVGSEVRLTLRDADDRERIVTLERVRQPGVMSQLGNLPPMRVRFEEEPVEHAGLRVGLIRFNIWLLPVAAEFDAAIDRYRDADAVILDLRGNPGGVGGMAMGLAGHFLDEPLSLGEMRTRRSVLHFRANPRRVNPSGERVVPFTGPVAILQDELSMSTSEIFAGGLQRLGRVRVFGETSGGQALPSRIERLPCGDALQFAFADFLDPDGVRLEGRGVIPDEVVPLRREELLDGCDAPMEAALRWIEYLQTRER
jgi:carboxyl-terminal processing protease